MSEPRVVIDVKGGAIQLEVFESRVPRAAAYFLRLVESGAYDGSTFYRSSTLGIVDGPRLVQAGPLGALFAPDGGSTTALSPPPTLESFETTADSGLVHETGMVSLARDLLDTGHVIPEIFICLGRFPQLDFAGRAEPDGRGFPVVGRVLEGLDVVRGIAAGDTQGRTPVERLRGEILSEPARISRALLRRAGDSES